MAANDQSTTPADNRQPFCYYIAWLEEPSVWYYGARFAKDCSPEDLWTTYFTSSQRVKEYREKYGEPDIVRVHRLFDTVEEAAEFEREQLQSIKDSGFWDRVLNQSIGGVYHVSEHSEDTINKMVASQAVSQASEKTRKKKSETWHKKPLAECIYCGLQTLSRGMITRWHNDNCKWNPINNTDGEFYYCLYCDAKSRNFNKMERWHNNNCPHK